MADQIPTCERAFEQEEWRPVVGYEGAYEVSSIGRVRSLSRTIVQPSSHDPNVMLHRRWTGRLLTVCTDRKTGYRYVGLGKSFSVRVHVLVARAFHGPRPEGQEVRHLDGERANNCLSNLQYGTRLENCADTVRHGRSQVGERHHGARLVELDVACVRSLAGVSDGRVAAALGVNRETVGMARRGVTWPHVGRSSASAAWQWWLGVADRAGVPNDARRPSGHPRNEKARDGEPRASIV